MDMPFSGTLTTILSGIEPAIAIVLACVPLMRPISKKFSSRKDGSRSGYYTGKLNGGYIKQKRVSHERSGDITELFEDDDDHSQIQLQPVDVSKAGTPVISYDIDCPAVPHHSRAITVKKSWAVSSE